MRKIIALLISLSPAGSLCGQSGGAGVTYSVDLRLELLSIVSRLAGYEEYSNDTNKSYVEAIHRHFDPYRDHPMIRYAREIKKSNGIGYDAIAILAVSIGQPPALKPIVPFAVQPLADSRWNEERAEKYVRLLQDFYRDARCAEFFAGQRGRYEFSVRELSKVWNGFHPEWFAGYFGHAPAGPFHVVYGLANGSHCYGPKFGQPGEGTDYYAIMCLWTDKTLDSLKYGIDTPFLTPILVHEFCHSFANPLVDAHARELEKPGRRILAATGETPAYMNWKTAMYESLVRASVYRYLKAYGADSATFERHRQMDSAQGFPWITELAAFLDEYERDRRRYLTLDSFMPRLVRFYDKLSRDLIRKKKRAASGADRS